MQQNSDAYSDILADLHPVNADALQSMVSQKTKAADTALNYLLHLHGDRDINEHPQKLMIAELAKAAERDDLVNKIR